MSFTCIAFTCIIYIVIFDDKNQRLESYVAPKARECL